MNVDISLIYSPTFFTELLAEHPRVISLVSIVLFPKNSHSFISTNLNSSRMLDA